ncbi:hypothetical protein AVEN_218319-1 [Araneus ventricosus]|uniref:Uncharacterized protein n=1 Tax=Araneus ventricosus TaxID=182803 RepID=A0A4Y2CBY7_ARAVE|nr:hypothetical protein AVEN_218319-1 [Araneus ventricosus]
MEILSTACLHIVSSMFNRKRMLLKEENLYCLATSDISKPVYEYESDVRGSSCKNAFIRDYIETFTSTFIGQNELQSFNYFNSVPSEEYGEATDDEMHFFYENDFAPEYRTKFPVLISLCFASNPVAKGIYRNTGFAYGQKVMIKL